MDLWVMEIFWNLWDLGILRPPPHFPPWCSISPRYIGVCVPLYKQHDKYIILKLLIKKKNRIKENIINVWHLKCILKQILTSVTVVVKKYTKTYSAECLAEKKSLFLQLLVLKQEKKLTQLIQDTFDDKKGCLAEWLNE